MGALLSSLPAPLGKEIEFFLVSEYSFDQVGLGDILVNLLFAVLAFLLVRKIGPYAIDRYYLEPYRNVSRGSAMANVLYRIIAPVIVLEVLHLALSVSLYFVFERIMAVDLRWISVAVYWVILFGIKITKRLFLAPKGLLLEALASLTLFMLFDSTVISRIPLEGLTVFDGTNIGFQMLISIGFMLVYWITSLIVGSTGFGEDPSAVLKERLEKTLYSYLRQFRHVIKSCKNGERFESDYLLRAIVLSVMYIEDQNRPKPVRQIENMLSRVGLSKTTGIMQCKMENNASHAKRCYTDEESIQVAVPKLITLWERFIYAAAMNGDGDSTGRTIWFTSNWYSFDAKWFEVALKSHFSLLYGEYRGSKVLDCDSVFAQILDFVKNERNQMTPSRIAVSSDLFEKSVQTYSDAVMTVNGGSLGFYGDYELEPGHGVYWSLTFNESTMDELNRIVKALRKTNATTIDSIRIENNVYCKVEYSGRSLQNLDLRAAWYKYEKPKARK